jgi:DNA invertase Pin-like site-specific DNA recombinase
MGSKVRCGIYVRISRDAEGKALGVERQEQDCRKQAERLGWTVVRVYDDNDRSASTLSKKPRPEFERMMEDARAGRLDAILAYSTSRLTRRPREFSDLIDLLKETGITLDTVVSGQANFNTADGRAVALTIAAWDAAEAERIGERTTRKHQELREQGRMVGARSFGWAKADDGRLSGELDEEEAAHVRAAAAHVLAGGSLTSLCRTWIERGITTTWGKPWKHGALRRMLTNPKVAGFRATKAGMVLDEHARPVQGQWTPILDVETWERVCAVLGRRTKPRGGTRHLLGGLLNCACGGVLWGMAGTDYRSGLPTLNYACGRCRATISDRKIRPLVEDAIVSSVLFGPVTGSQDETERKALEARLASLKGKDDRLLELAAEGVYSVAETGAKRTAIRAEIDQVHTALDALRADDVLDHALTQARADLWSGGRVSITEAAKVRAQIRDRFHALPMDRQQALIRGSLSIAVRKVGKGSREERVTIHHLVAPGLNESSLDPELVSD